MTHNPAYGHYGQWGSTTETSPNLPGPATEAFIEVLQNSGMDTRTPPANLKDLFVKMKRNSIKVGDSDSSVKSKTGIGKITYEGTEYAGVVSFLQYLFRGSATAISLPLTAGIYDDNMAKAVDHYQKLYVDSLIEVNAPNTISVDGEAGPQTLGTFFDDIKRYKAPSRSKSSSKTSVQDTTKEDKKEIGIFELAPFFRKNNFWLYFSGAMVAVAIYAIVTTPDDK